MTAKEYTNRIRSLISDLPEIAERLCVLQAQSGLAIVKNRSINEGIFIDSQEGATTDYSKNKIATSNFKGKERNSSGTEFIKQNRLGTWHEFRKAQGLSSEKINLSYSNRTWTSIDIVKVARSESGVLVTVSTKDPSAKELLLELSNRYGNFINPTNSEAMELKTDTAKEFLTEIKKRL